MLFIVLLSPWLRNVKKVATRRRNAISHLWRKLTLDNQYASRLIHELLILGWQTLLHSIVRWTQHHQAMHSTQNLLQIGLQVDPEQHTYNHFLIIIGHFQHLSVAMQWFNSALLHDNFSVEDQSDPKIPWKRENSTEKSQFGSSAWNSAACRKMWALQITVQIDYAQYRVPLKLCFPNITHTQTNCSIYKICV